MSINARYQDIDDYEEYEDEEEKDFSIIPILGVIAKWFIRIGIVCAIISAIYYLVTLKIVNLLLFAIGLIISYFFGYFVMFCIYKVGSLFGK